MGTDISPVKIRKPHGGFMTVLSSAACEWFLIFLLFLDAALSYLLVKFAHYCELKEPCPLCSRFDHIFRRNKSRSFYTLLCNNHKEEISLSVPCSVHGNFADINTLCEECLVPSAMERKSSSESYRLLAGKLWVDVEQSVFHHLVMNKYIHLGSSIRKTCLCCNKTWRTKSNAERLLEFTPVALGASKANVKPPLPRVPGRSRFSRRDSLKRLREKITGPVKPLAPSGSSTLAHVGYTKLKIASDSESEFPFSEDDDDDANTVCSFRSVKSVKSYSNGERDIQFGNRGVQKSPMVSNTVLEKKTSQGLQAKHAIVDQPNLLDLTEHKSDSSSKSDVFLEHGLRELNWTEYYKKPVKSVTTELVSVDGGHPQSNEGGNIVPPVEESASSVSLPHMSALSVLSELLSLGPSLSDAVMVPTMTNNNVLISENGNATTVEHAEADHSDDNSLSKQDNMNPIDSSNDNELISENGNATTVKHAEAARSDDNSLSKQDNVNSIDSSNDNELISENGNATTVKHAEAAHSNDNSLLKQDNMNSIDSSNNNELSENGNAMTVKHAEAVHSDDNSSSKKDNMNSIDSSNNNELSENGNATTVKHAEAAHSDDNSPSKQDNMISIDSSENMKSSNNDDIEHINIDDSVEIDEEETKSLPQVSPIEVFVPSQDDHYKLTAHEKEELMTHEKEEESRKDNDSSSEVVRVTDSLPRNYSLESLDGINVGDIEGESIVDRLKRQMISLYKELEEERNAAAIAANEAMAMITRLQEEKSALHMEALQYLRMMEEQAEYDMEALEKSNDLLAEKEKELQDLEAELEFYRMNLLDESGVPDLPQEYSNTRSSSSAFTQNISGTFGNSKVNEISIGNGNGVPMNSTIQSFHDEKLQMLQHLRHLEEKLRQSYCSGKLDGINSENKDQENGEQVHKINPSLNRKTELNGSSTHDEENDCLYGKSEKLAESQSETSSVILEEIAEIHDRLEALETR